MVILMLHSINILLHYFIVFHLKWTWVVMGNIHKERMCNAGHKGLHV